MTTSDWPVPADLPQLSTLRPHFEQCLSEPGCDRDELYRIVHRTVCAYADAGVPVEQTLAMVNRELSSIAGVEGVGIRDAERVKMVRNLALSCVLDCYYPDDPRRPARLESA
jgi:hypothetical protein